MLSNVIKYSGIFAKVSALKSELLTEDDFLSLAKQKDMNAFTVYLKTETVYQNALTTLSDHEIGRIPIERSLSKSLYMDFQSIYHFMTDIRERRFLDTYYLKYETGLLKSLLRMLFDQRDIKNAIPKYDTFFEKHIKIDMDKLLYSRDISEFLENLSNTEFHSVLNKINKDNISLFDLEMQVDLYGYLKIWKCHKKCLSKENLKSQTNISNAEIDLHNIMWIYRAKKYYHTESSLIYTYLIPISTKLNKTFLDALITAPDESAFFELMRESRYKLFYENMVQGNLELGYYLEMKRIHDLECKLQPHSLATVTSFLFYKGLEIRNLTTLIECVRYGLDPEEAMRKLVLR